MPQMAGEAQPAYRTKLIEVALPLEAINKESAREKSIRHGHPSTLHLCQVRQPLSACQAVPSAQPVDDPCALPKEFSPEGAQGAELQRRGRRESLSEGACPTRSGLDRQHGLQVVDRDGKHFIGELTQLRRDPTTRRMSNHDASTLVLRHPHRFSQIPIPSEQKGGVVRASLREADQVEHDERVHTFLLTLGAELKVLLELRYRYAACRDGALDGLVPARYILPDVPEAQLDTWATGDGVKCSTLSRVLRVTWLKRSVVPVGAQERRRLALSLLRQPGNGPLSVRSNPPRGRPQRPSALSFEVPGVDEGNELGHGELPKKKRDLNEARGKPPQRGGTSIVCQLSGRSVNSLGERNLSRLL